MSTPICDFVRRYVAGHPVRLHMPGHKGIPVLGYEPYDITEIDGADELFAPEGIIAESEAQASALFGAATFYATGGSTLCIQAMLYLLAQYAVSKGERPCILAGRNAHKALVNAAALLDVDIIWLYPEDDGSYHTCRVTAAQVQEALTRCAHRPTAVYLTSPDYLGDLADVTAIAAVCHQFGTLLAVDNAHGAYLRFLPESWHPLDLGADICCDSAHKTLPVVTGGAYLHLSPAAPTLLTHHAKAALSLFGSSSPSYLILQSLDAVNDRMAAFRRQLSELLPRAATLKERLIASGYTLTGEESLKLTLCPKYYGYTGDALAQCLMNRHIYPEFYDTDYVVLMLSPANTAEDLSRLEETLMSFPRMVAITAKPPVAPHPQRILTPHQTLLADREILPVEQCLGRISAAAAISCPPAIPLVVCGERIDQQVVDCFHYYGIEHCTVIKA